MAKLNATLSFDLDTYAEVDNETLVIDARTREIYIPDPENVFGVQYDKDSKCIHFRVINTVSENFKMEDSVIRINYKDSKNIMGSSLAVDVVTYYDTCEFTWVVPNSALKNNGVLYFVVSATIAEANLVTQRWATTLAKVTTPESIYVKSVTIDATERDEVASMLLLVAEKCNNAKTDIQNVVDAGLLSLEEKTETGKTTLDNLIQKYGLKMSDLDALKSRVDQLVANPEGSPTVNTELADVRIGYDGHTYGSAGSAVRDQIATIMEMLLNNKFSVPLGADDESILVDEDSNIIVADWKWKIIE